MNHIKLICEREDIIYNQGYITLQMPDYDIPQTFDTDGVTLHKKDRFHVSLLCVKNILEMKPGIEDEIIQHFCNFLSTHELKFTGFTKQFRLAQAGERMSIVALCTVTNLDTLAAYLTAKLGVDIAPLPAHVTLYTLQPNVGIGLNSQEEMEQKSTEIIVPEAVLAPLMGYKKVMVVDENDNEIGAEFMMDAITKGLLRRAARIFVFNESGQLLMQQRSEKVLKPLLLDQSAAGHVDAGETYEEAAYRELAEELGIKNVELELVETSFRSTNFYSAIYRLTVSDNTEINFDPEEIKQVLWYNIVDLEAELTTESEKFTPAFKEVWIMLKDKLT